MILSILYDVNRFTGVDLVAFHAVTAKVLDTLDGERVVANSDLVRLHRLLDRRAKIAEYGVDAGFLDSCLCSRFHGLKQGIVAFVESHSEGTICHETFNVRAIIDFHHIVVLENRLVVHIRRPMRCTVIQTSTCGEGDTCIESTLLN